MPNHVQNIIRFNSEDDFQRVISECLNEKGHFDFGKIIPMPDNIFRGNLGQEERKQYGANNWYDWSIANWGTKWNAYESSAENNAISFQTAWSMPRPVLDAMIRKFSDLSFVWLWADEDIGCNTGEITVESGNATESILENESNEAYELFIDCWGKTDCIGKDADGNWIRYDCDDCPNPC